MKLELTKTQIETLQSGATIIVLPINQSILTSWENTYKNRECRGVSNKNRITGMGRDAFFFLCVQSEKETKI